MYSHRHCRGWLAVLAGLMLVLAAGCGERKPGAGPQRGDPLPELRLSGLLDGRTSSTAGLHGKVLLINFWATWCEPCRNEMASLEALSRRYGAHQLAVLGISIDADVNLAREFVLQYRLTFPNFTEREPERARDLLRVRTLPESVIVSADGIVVARVTGARDWISPEAVAMLDAVIRGAPVAAPPALY